jgi:hypothetical protein
MLNLKVEVPQRNLVKVSYTKKAVDTKKLRKV